MRLTPLLAALLAVLPVTALAQTEALPDLTPREFEIQGDLQVDFSGIQRQPLTGFGPPPRAYVVPAERVFTERAYGYPVEQIAPPTLAGQPVPKPDLLRPLSGLAEGLAGVYAARAARLRLQRNGTRGALYLDADYDGASTYAPFDTDVSDGTAIYNRATGAVGYESYGGLQVEAGGRFLDHELYGARFAAPTARPGSALPDQPTRTTGHGYAALTYGDAFAPAAVRARYAFTATSTDLADVAAPAGLGDDPSEGRLTLEGHATWQRLRFDAHGTLAGTGSALGSDVQGYSLGAGFLLRETAALRLEVGAAVLGSDGPLASSAASLGPVVRFALQPRRSTVRFAASNEPQVLDQSLGALLETNPFAERAPLVMPEVQPLNARADLEAQLGAVRTTLYTGLQVGENARYYERDAQTGLFAVGYGDARRVFGGVEAAVGASERVEVTAGLEVRTGRLTDADADLPYYAPVVGHATVSTALLRERLRLEVQAYAEGTRPADRLGGEAPGFFDLSAEAAFHLTDRLDVLLRGGGLAGEVERWAGYPEAPFTVLGGVRARW